MMMMMIFISRPSMLHLWRPQSRAATNLSSREGDWLCWMTCGLVRIWARDHCYCDAKHKINEKIITLKCRLSSKILILSSKEFTMNIKWRRVTSLKLLLKTGSHHEQAQSHLAECCMKNTSQLLHSSCQQLGQTDKYRLCLPRATKKK